MCSASRIIMGAYTNIVQSHKRWISAKFPICLLEDRTIDLIGIKYNGRKFY